MRDRIRMNAICAFYENKKLDMNEHKDDWKNETLEELWIGVIEEFDESGVEMNPAHNGGVNLELLKDELADLINRAKMALEKAHDMSGLNRVRALK